MNGKLLRGVVIKNWTGQRFERVVPKTPFELGGKTVVMVGVDDVYLCDLQDLDVCIDALSKLFDDMESTR